MKNKEKSLETRKKTRKEYTYTSSKSNYKLKEIVVYLAILLAVVVLCYFLLGLVEAGVIGAGLFLVLLIGYFLDKPKTKSKKRKVFKTILIIILIIGIIGILGIFGFIYYIVKNAPDFNEELFKAKESTVIYDSAGKEYAKLGKELRENIEYDELSEVFIDALIATEDSRFFQHNGFDLMRFAKAAAGQAMGQGDSGGGSTITMQLSKNTLTNAEARGFAGIVRKFTDIYIAIFQIERNYTKEQIIEFYANNHTLGGIIFGVQEASRYFFNKDAKDLNLVEAATIAGMYQAPSSYNPFNHPQAAQKRRNTVLYYMERHGYITHEERMEASKIPVESTLTDTAQATNAYQGYIDLVCEEVQNKYGVDPYSVPMLIYSNMIRSTQDGINNIYKNGSTGNFYWKDEDMQAGVAVVDSTSGKILAIGAGRNRTGAKTYSYATFKSDSQRQIGSTAKPLFDYGPGMEYNNWSTYTIFTDEPYSYSNGKKINNYDGQYRGAITLRYALSDSRNIPALKAFQAVDNKKIIELVTSVGITPEISNGYIHEAHAIGAFTGSNPLSMAGAYQMFSNGGYYYEPYSVSKVIFRDGSEEVIEYSSPKVKIISDSTAFMITDVLKGVGSYWGRLGLNKDYIAIKTGTTNVDADTIRTGGYPSDIIRDYWIMGYTHNVVIGIWIGYDKLSKTHYLRYNNTDGTLRDKLFNAVAKVALKHDGIDFTKPNSVVAVKVEKGSNPAKLPSSNTPATEIVTEYFKRGTEPTEISTKYTPVDTPTNFKVVNHKTYVTLSWDAVKDPEFIENGVFGYYILFDGKKIDFTTDTTYTIDNLTSYYGVYTLRAGYKGTDDSLSNPATFEISENNYTASVTTANTTLNVGDNISSNLYDGSVVSFQNNGKKVTDYEVSIVIKDNAGNTVTTPSSSTPNVYTITYTIKYDSKTFTCSNTITIKENENNNENDTNN